MGQKVNPHGIRVGVIKDWDSRWFVSDEKFGDTLVSDYKVRTFLKKELQKAGLAKIEIERDNNERVRVVLHCAKPGLVIGKGGVEIERYRAALEKLTGKAVVINVAEIKNPDLNAQLVAENICGQLEGRVAFRRAMKMAIRNTMKNGAKGIKISCSGRLAGAEIARTEHYHEGTIPLQTLRADIDYGFFEANTTYGKIGVKVWIYKGEVFNVVNRSEEDDRRRRNENNRGNRKDRKPGDRKPFNKGDRKDGFKGGDRKGGFNNRGERKDGQRSERRPRPETKPAEKAPKEGGEQ